MPNNEFEVYAIGLCAASVCTSLSTDEAAKRLNEEHPTGISSKWGLSESPTFGCGTPNGCNCPDNKSNKHYLFNC